MTAFDRDAHWETLLDTPEIRLRRSGRYLVVDLRSPHVVLSTSQRNGGQTDRVRFLVNHQSCEGTGHEDRQRVMHDLGLDAYHDQLCAEAGLPPEFTAVMGTAANMNYAAIVAREDRSVVVTAVVTAGVEGNATTAGDPSSWRETDSGFEKIAYAGTINTLLLVNRPMEAGALARAVVTMTEGKTAALQRLAISSRQSNELATGTGTDQYCVAAPAGGARPLTSASPHVKAGELIGAAVRDATLEALRWQNGLEPSYTRGFFHALGRFGVKEATVFEDLTALMDAGDLELLRKNSKAVFYEPLAGAAAYALASVLDRIRHGCLPASVEAQAIVQQAATLAASVAARPERWADFRARLEPHAARGPRALALAAIAYGWAAKWRSN